MMENETLPHSYFKEAIWRWTLTMQVNKWMPIAPKTMTIEEFTNCIKYLISCGEPLEFTTDFSAFRKFDTSALDYI